jgi:tRNA 5-methylaminomethyl-2-thiouridine biosynthesis bifunctional protein
MIDGPDLIWTEDGPPRSGRFGDVYFSAEDGLAESRAVFLAGCGLPGAWASRRRFVVAETGFGAGLNVLALLDLWRRAGSPGGVLHVFTIEAYPLSREEAARVHARWPELAEASAALLAGWPARTPGFHRIDLPTFDAIVDVAHLEAAEALAAWTGRADAWFLDGFAPAANESIWRDAVLDGIAARSAPGARLATFTVAGRVRRGLAERGFAVERKPGFGRKRERLEARFAGRPAAEPAPPSVAIVGAGIAGASLARAFGALGLAPAVLDPGGPAAGASGNAAALVTPRFDAGGGPVAALYAQAFRRAVALYRTTASAAVVAQGVLQLEATDRDAPRFDKVAAQPFWPENTLRRLDAGEVASRLGEPVARGGLDLTEALTVDPVGVVRGWLHGVRVERRGIARLQPADDGWRLFDPDGLELGRYDAVCVAAGPQAAALVGAPLFPVRGQATVVEGVRADALAWGGYLAPTRAGVLFGATHDRGDASDDPRPADDARNLAALAAALPAFLEQLRGRPTNGRASVRAAVADRLPVAGPVPGRPGLFVLGGLGSRGFATAPLLAEHLAAIVAGAPSPLPSALGATVEPDRPAARWRDEAGVSR